MRTKELEAIEKGTHCGECALRRLVDRLTDKLKEVSAQRDALLEAAARGSK